MAHWLVLAALIGATLSRSHGEVAWNRPGTEGPGDYYDGNNWDGGVVPTAFESIAIENGGRAQSSIGVSVDGVRIGGSSTLAVLAGINSQFLASESVTVGDVGLGTLTIGSQALMTAGNFYAGSNVGTSGVITMDGGFLSPFTTYIGYEGSGTMTLENGSTLKSTTGYVGYLTGSQGVVNLTNSTWEAENEGLPRDITVGVQGSGQIQATGSEISAESLVLGSGSGATGTISASGGTITVEDTLIVGLSGSGELSLTDSAAVTAYGVTIGSAAGSTGTLNITDSTLTSTTTLFVGLAGNGTLDANGATIEAPELFVGRSPGSTSSATVSGGALSLSGELHVGAEGNGTFTLEGGGSLHSDKGNMAFAAGTTGEIHIGTGTWTNTQAIFVGISGEGTLQIDTGGTIHSESGYLAQEAVGTGTVILVGGSWNMTNTLAIGVNGNATLSASSGAEITAEYSQLGLQGGSNGSATINAATWTTWQEFTIATAGNGQVTLENGATLSAASVEIAAEIGVTGSLSVINSTLVTETLLAGSGTATVEFAGATFQLLGGSAVLDTLLIDGFADGAVTVASGGLTVDTQGGNAQIPSALTGAGGLTKTGAGRLRLTTTNTYAGGTEITGGALEIIGDTTLGAGNVTLASGELRAYEDASVSGEVSSGIQLVSVSANQTGTFSATAGHTLTLAPLNITFEAGSTARFGSTGNTGTVVLAPTGTVSVAADTEIFVDFGTLQAGNGALLSMAGTAESITVGSGATLDFNDQVTGGAVKSLNGSGTVVTGTDSNSTLAVASGNFGGSFLGIGNLAKQSTGTLILSGNSTISGNTTIEAGVLQVDGFLGNGTVLVESGGTLGGTGTVVQVSLLDGGTLAPGSSAGTLTVAEVLWHEGGIMVFDLGPTSDLLVADALQGFSELYYFTFQDLGWSVGTTYDLISVDPSFTNIAASDFRFTNSGGFSGTFAYSDNALQFTLESVPEPSAGLLLVLGAGLVLWRRSPRRNLVR